VEDDGARQSDALLLAAGKLMRMAVARPSRTSSSAQLTRSSTAPFAQRRARSGNAMFSKTLKCGNIA
jgi:hypothetical protein